LNAWPLAERAPRPGPSEAASPVTATKRVMRATNRSLIQLKFNFILREIERRLLHPLALISREVSKSINRSIPETQPLTVKNRCAEQQLQKPACTYMYYTALTNCFRRESLDDFTAAARTVANGPGLDCVRRSIIESIANCRGQLAEISARI